MLVDLKGVCPEPYRRDMCSTQEVGMVYPVVDPVPEVAEREEYEMLE